MSLVARCTCFIAGGGECPRHAEARRFAETFDLLPVQPVELPESWPDTVRNGPCSIPGCAVCSGEMREAARRG